MDIFLSLTSKIISSKTEFADMYQGIYNIHLIYLKSLLLNCINTVRDNQDIYTSQIYFTLLSQFGNYFSMFLYSHSKFRSHEQQFVSTSIMQYQLTLDSWGESHNPFFFLILVFWFFLLYFDLFHHIGKRERRVSVQTKESAGVNCSPQFLFLIKQFSRVMQDLSKVLFIL